VITKKKAPARKPESEPKTPEPEVVEAKPTVSEKRRLVAFLLCFFLGGLSAHRFYAGKKGSAVVQVLTLGGFTIWLFIDLIMILAGKFKDKSGLPISEW
jgi:hypothetical protein